MHLITDRTTIIALLIAIAGCGSGTEDAPGAIDAHIVSSRPDMVTGGDAVIEGLSLNVRLSVDGQSIPVEPRGALAYVSGLPEGRHDIVGEVAGTEVLRIPYANYPRQGPVISGPHEQPFFCETDDFEVGPGAGMLPKSEPPLCVVPERSDGFAPTVGGGYTLVSRAQAQVTVRTGVINRAIYQIAVPVDWNGRLVYKFGGGCRGGWYRQGNRTGGVLDTHLLGSGYAVASASLNVFGFNCNDLLASETMMMVKERFIEEHGVPEFTIGLGCSGGSYQSYQTVDNYPGLLDGILVGCSFPEVGHAMVTVLTDARLLKHYFDWANRETAVKWTTEDKLAVSGFANEGVLARTADGASRVVSVKLDGWTSAEFADVIPQSVRYDPDSLPTGARPTVFDHTVNVYGRNPAAGYAHWPLDNRGIEYGLEAFRDGRITAEQFVHLNRYVGGLNRDGEFVPERIHHDPAATSAAYESGRILDGGRGLNNIPIIDYRAWADARGQGDTHLEYHTYSTRERLVAANGNADNQVVLTEDGLCEGCSLFSFASPVLQDALKHMDRWIELVESDQSPGTRAEKVRRNKPEGLEDACWIEGRKIAERQAFSGGICNEAFRTHGFPRLVAGAPLRNNIVACTRRPLTDGDVEGLGPGQREMLQATFADGVCDWSKAGEAQVAAGPTWWRVPGDLQ